MAKSLRKADVQTGLSQGKQEKYNAFFICLLLVCCIFWFFPYLRNGIIMGDDLSLAKNLGTVGIKEAFIPEDATKYRPVFSLFCLAVSEIITGSYYELFFINLIIHWINAIILYKICNLIGKNSLRSFLIGLLFVSCQFSYYNVLQGFGMMEGLALSFVLGSMYFGVCYMNGEKLRDFLLMVLYSLLAAFTHERFIILSIVCAMAALLSAKPGWKRKTVMAVIALIPIISNWFIKSVIFKANFMTGTGGSSIALDFRSVIGFFLEGLAAIMAINKGPEYLNGYTFDRYTTAEKVTAVALCLLLSAGSLYAIIKSIREKQDHFAGLRRLILFCALIGGTLVCGCVTIRLELRWVIAPYAVFLAFLAYVSRNCAYQRTATAWLLLITVLWMPLNYQYSKNLGNVFFVRSMGIAKQTYENTIQKYGESLADAEVFIIGNDELEWADGLQPWQGTSLFSMYMKTAPLTHFVKNEEDIHPSKEMVKVFRMNDDLTVTEIDYPGLIGERMNQSSTREQ